MKVPLCSCGVYNFNRVYIYHQDSNFDIRLFGEHDYDEEPPAETMWLELAR